MAPLKRKRPHDDTEPPPPPTAAAESTRRATRQTPIPPPPIPTSSATASSSLSNPQLLAPAADEKRPAARRTASNASKSTAVPQKISETPIPIPITPSSSVSSQTHLLSAQSAGQNSAIAAPRPLPPPPTAAAAAAAATLAAAETRATRRKSGTISENPVMAVVKEAKENVRPVTLVAPKITYQAAQPQSRRTGSLVRPSPPTGQPPITQHFRPAPRPSPSSYQHTIPATVTAVPVPVPPTSTTTSSIPTSTPSKQSRLQLQQSAASLPTTATTTKPATLTTTTTKTTKLTSSAATQKPVDRSAPRTDRNIDKVMLGNICFKAWYPSYYGKEVLGDASASAKGGAVGSSSSKNPPVAQGDVAVGGAGAKNNHRKGADTPILDRLYVCPACFKYSKELVAWWGHVRMCESAGTVPGKKIYVHPRGRRLVRREIARTSGKKTNFAPKYTEEYVTDEGEWSVWEVDGEQDVLFCQNISLFAKLFLDNKSVFFDVRGFNYFLLVYTPAPKTVEPTEETAPPPRPHVVGFFSKEKMSWDNNNLACILVFPPWQRKGLGALLMGVSYEISRREGVLGGPEKPISELGRKGYKRFWGGEIARWLLGLPANDSYNSSNNGEADPSLLVDVEDCCNATWIALDDCLATLREMGVVAEAGTGPGKPPPKKKWKRDGGDGGGEGKDEDVEMRDDDDEVEEEEDGERERKEMKPDVPRVKVDKAAVRAWVAANGISLEMVCDPDGFVEGYAIKERGTENVDE